MWKSAFETKATFAVLFLGYYKFPVISSRKLSVGQSMEIKSGHDRESESVESP